MIVTPKKLTSAAGLAAVAAGLIFVLIQFVHPSENATTVTTVTWVVVSGLTATMAILATIGSIITVLVPVLPHAFERLLALPMGAALAALGYSLWSREHAVPSQLEVDTRREPRTSARTS